MLHHQILLVDDDDEVRYLLQEAFAQSGYRGHIKMLSSGDAALNYLQALSAAFYPSLIVLDFNMPGISGAAILAQFRKMDVMGQVPVIFYSAGMRPAVRELLIALGAAACFEKPTTKQGISELVHSFLGLAEKGLQGYPTP